MASRERLLLLAKAKAKRDRELASQSIDVVQPIQTPEQFAAGKVAKDPRFAAMDPQALTQAHLKKDPSLASRIEGAENLPSISDRISQLKTEGFKKDHPFYSALYPRGAESAAQGGGASQAFGAAIGDTFSAAGRLFASIDSFKGGKDTFEENFKEYLKDVGEKEGEGAIQNILRHPATGAALFLAPLLAPLGLGGVAFGAAEAVGVTGVTQAANIGEDKGFNEKEAIIDTGLSMLLPGLGHAIKPVKKALQNTAVKIMDSVIKPSKKLQKGVVPFSAKKIFELGFDSPKGIGAMNQNVKREMGLINKEYGAELAKIPSSTKIDLDRALNTAKQKLSSEIEKGLHSADYKGIEKGLKYWDDYLATHAKGPVSVGRSLSIRKGAGKLASYDKLDPNAVKGTEKAAQWFREEINKQLDAFPDIRKLDKRKSELIPIDQAIDDAIPRIQKNFIQSLNDNPGLISMSLGGGAGAGAGSFAGPGGAAAGGLMGMLPGAGMLMASKAQKSPGFSSMLHSTGNKLGLAGDIMNNPTLQRTVPGLARQPLQNLLGDN